MATAEEMINEVLEDNYSKLKENGKLYLILILSMIPSLCYTSFKLHVVKIGASKILHCQNPKWNNTTWANEENHLKHLPLTHRHCFSYKYVLENTTPIDINYTLYGKEFDYCWSYQRTILGTRNDRLMSVFLKDFSAYCQSLKYEIYYDVLAAIIPVIICCLFILPFADIVGRHRVLVLGCKMIFVSAFIKFLFTFCYTREAIGESVTNFAYPVLKYTTQSIIVEIMGEILRPFAFAITFVGGQIPPIFAYFVTPLYWKLAVIIACIPALFLPPLLWCLPESPLWFFSRKKYVAAQFFAEVLDDSVLRNETLSALRNRKICFKDIKALLNEFKKINKLEFALINALSVCVGFLWFYPYSKHKLMFADVDSTWTSLVGIFGTLLSLPLLYCMDLTKFSLAGLFMINGILFAFLAKFILDVERNSEVIVLVRCFVEIISVTLRILFEFYLHQIVPISHRCMCVAICGASVELGLMIVICLRELINVFVSEVSASAMCFIGFILTIPTVKNSQRFKPLLLNFSDTKESKTTE